MPRNPILPDDVGRLTPPNDDEHPPAYRFFGYEETHRFDAAAIDYHPVNAAWLADAAFLAYSHPSVVEGAFDAIGLKWRSMDVGDTQRYVAHDDRKVVVAFRGTGVSKLGRPGWRDLVFPFVYVLSPPCS